MSDSVEPDTVEPDTVEPDTVHSDAIASETVDSDTAEPDVIDLRERIPTEQSNPAGSTPTRELPLGAPSLSAALEALLLLADEPQPAVMLAEVVGRPEVEVESCLAELAMQYLGDGRGIELRRVDSGWRFYTAASCRELITRYVTDGRQSRLSQAALETLAIIAYRQPVSRAQVGAVRGVNPDGVIKTLQARGLITEESGGEHVTRFVTTDYFLDRMGLDSLSELPPIADHLPDLGSLDDLID
ncbi:MAG: SMC-Scp complex subunit ScpB [Candidatus Nanopelagicales bacterium]